MYHNWNFWFANIPSGNPVPSQFDRQYKHEEIRQKCVFFSPADFEPILLLYQKVVLGSRPIFYSGHILNQVRTQARPN
jgi:hypothetical protein